MAVHIGPRAGTVGGAAGSGGSAPAAPLAARAYTFALLAPLAEARTGTSLAEPERVQPAIP